MEKNISLTEQNRILITAFADIFYTQKNVRKAFEEFVSENYIQHNPSIIDGKEAAIAMLEPKFSHPNASFSIKKILVDGNLSVIHLHGKMNQESLGGAVADFYRIENGKIMEHWDVLQPIPTECINSHPMF
jgi:predicted SnoaL-like aldol condensation-catalyzing enzyme